MRESDKGRTLARRMEWVPAIIMLACALILMQDGRLPLAFGFMAQGDQGLDDEPAPSSAESSVDTLEGVDSLEQELSDGAIFLPMLVREFAMEQLRFEKIITLEPTEPPATPTPSNTPTPSPTFGPSPTPLPPSCDSPLDERIEISTIDRDGVAIRDPRRTGFADRQPLVLLPQADNGALIGWAGRDGEVHITPVDSAGVRSGDDFTVKGEKLSAMTQDDDGGLGLLVARGDEMHLVLVSADRESVIETKIVGGESQTKAGSKWIDDWGHEARLTFSGRFFSVYMGHTQFFGADGKHQGDLLWHYDQQGEKIEMEPGSTPDWNWGCSHSMDVRMVHNRESDVLMPVCVSDCYPKKAILHNRNTLIRDEPGNCAGQTDGRLGGLDLYENGFAMSYASKTGRSNFDIGLLTMGFTGVLGEVNWLTEGGPDEEGPHLARYGEIYLAGWRVGDDMKLAATNQYGEIEEGPTSVDAIAGDRDDFATFENGDVGWAYRQGNDLKMARVPYCRVLDTP